MRENTTVQTNTSASWRWCKSEMCTVDHDLVRVTKAQDAAARRLLDFGRRDGVSKQGTLATEYGAFGLTHGFLAPGRDFRMPRVITEAWLHGPFKALVQGTPGLVDAKLQAGRLTDKQRQALTTYLDTVGPLMAEMAENLRKMSDDLGGVAATKA